ncbi:uncharacterized protein LOC106779948 [Vigna radiata var. radiata]|uniref:Uncharacterized protein LOC106779948 n=1 Tax=Vigna radiata var. radiata TaxID=3916 RepID=A0A1S3VZ68_VIGRR|nr:uncharacterized protein LOC106779948 [Vigna radiata var. radiata]
MQAQMPDRPPPPIERFDGTSDPEHHLRNFIDSMAYYSKSDPVKCRAFSQSIKGEALKWYYTIPPNSVDSFRTVITLFKKQYTINRRDEITPTGLVNIKQGKYETLRAFVQIYNEAARRAKGVNHEFIIGNLPNCLKPGYVSEHLFVKQPKTMEELQERLTEYIKMEDQRISRRKQPSETSTNEITKEVKRPRERDQLQRFLRRNLSVPLGPHYDHYAKLNTSRERVFEKALQANLIFVHKRQKPTDADDTKVCRYHDNRGHTTEGCQGLKDELERLICAGYLREFVQEKANLTRRSPRKEPIRRSPEKIRPTDRSRSRSQGRAHDRPARGRIDTISGGFAGGGASSSARKRHLRNLQSVHNVSHPPTVNAGHHVHQRGFPCP